MLLCIEQKKNELIVLCQSLGIEKLYVFGSAVSTRFKEDSDIDFLISFSDKLTINQYTDNYFTLHYELRSLFNRKTDVVTDKMLSNPYFIESVNESKQLIYEA